MYIRNSTPRKDKQPGLFRVITSQQSILSLKPKMLIDGLPLDQARHWIGIVCFLFVSSTITSLSAQVNASAAPGDVIMTTDLMVIGWKAPVDYATVLAEEKSNITLLLSDPNLKPHQIALYTSGDHMVAYMQEDLLALVPINIIAENNYKRILSEIPTDPVMKYVDPQELAMMYEQIKTRLIQP